ncbi:hypothetical protein XENOCAPTIV_002266, partial [Xenoophorus captivus]
MLQRSYFLSQWGVCQTLAEKIGWSRKDIIDGLNQELDPMWIRLPGLCPRYFSVCCLLMHGKCPLSLHPYQPTTASFLHP